MLALLLLAVALGLDNLAAAIGFGAGAAGRVSGGTRVRIAVVFGVVSVAMSLAGLELGARIGAAAGERSELIACLLLIVVGAVIAAGVL